MLRLQIIERWNPHLRSGSYCCFRFSCPTLAAYNYNWVVSIFYRRVSTFFLVNFLDVGKLVRDSGRNASDSVQLYSQLHPLQNTDFVTGVDN